jgi:hypothetical protein
VCFRARFIPPGFQDFHQKLTFLRGNLELHISPPLLKC